MEESTSCSLELRQLINRLVLGGQVLFLRRLSVCYPEATSGVRMYSLSKPLLDELLQVPSDSPTVNSLVPFAVVVGTVFPNPGSEGCVG